MTPVTPRPNELLTRAQKAMGSCQLCGHELATVAVPTVDGPYRIGEKCLEAIRAIAKENGIHHVETQPL